MLGEMFSFSIVKKIGEGNYLNQDHFIIERVRRARALNMRRIRPQASKKSRIFSDDDRPSSS